MNRLALLAAAVLCAASARGEKLLGPPTDAQQAEARRLLESNNGAGARGCLGERRVYEAFHRVDPALAWNPDNPADWYLASNTLGLIEQVILSGYGEASRQWNGAFNGADFAAIGAPCRAQKTPRGLAACVNDRVRAYFAERPGLHAFSGGDCKMYSSALAAVASRLPGVTREAAVVSSLQHAINKISVRDAQGREHVFLIDSLNNLVVQLGGEKGACPDEGTMADASAVPAKAAPPDAREAEMLTRQRRARELVGRAESAAPVP